MFNIKMINREIQMYNCDIISNMIQMQGINQDKKIFENVKNLSVGEKSINTPSSQVEN